MGGHGTEIVTYKNGPALKLAIGPLEEQDEASNAGQLFGEGSHEKRQLSVLVFCDDENGQIWLPG
jgi:hypothetical protein